MTGSQPDPLGRKPKQPVPAVLALGSNLGERLATLQSAITELARVEGVRPTAVSEVVQTVAVGGPPQPDYLNAVLLASTSLSALDLLTACQQIEARHGRVRTVRWGPRTLDLDLISYAELVAADARLELPHPRARVRAFVLAPWLNVDPQATLADPAGPVPVAQLLAKAPDRDGLRARPDLHLEVTR